MIRPIAVLTLSNWGGIAILEINERDEEVTYKWYDDEPATTKYYFDEEEAYFIVGETQYYFNEFMRIGGY